MEVKELKKLYEIECYVTTKGCDGKEGKKWYVLPAEMSAVDAIKMAANKLHVGSDKILETRGFVVGDKLYLRKSWQKVPMGAVDVWAITVRR